MMKLVPLNDTRPISMPEMSSKQPSNPIKDLSSSKCLSLSPNSGSNSSSCNMSSSEESTNNPKQPTTTTTTTTTNSIVFSIEDDFEFRPTKTPSTSDVDDDHDDDADSKTTQPSVDSKLEPEVACSAAIGQQTIELDCGTKSDDQSTIELRFLVRRREAGAVIGKRGVNIKRLRETFRSSMFSIPDTGNGPERVVCIVTSESNFDEILTDISELMKEKSPENDEQIELKLLIHSSHAGSIIGIGGQSIKKLRNDSKAAIKIYEMCCPLSNERVCAIKAKPPVVVNAIKLIQAILKENPIKGTIKPYDALHFDLNLIDKYGGYLPDELICQPSSHVPDHHQHHQHQHQHLRHQPYRPHLAHHQHQQQQQQQQHFSDRHQMQANVAAIAAAAAAAATAGYSSKHYQLWTPTTELELSQRQPEPVVDQRTELLGKLNHQASSGLQQQAMNNRSARFHPYAQANRFSQVYQLVARSNGPIGFQARPQARFPIRPAQFNQQTSTRQQFISYHQQQQPRLMHQSPNNFNPISPNACRHLRPCLCMLMPSMTSDNNNNNQTNSPMQQQQPNNMRTATRFNNSSSSSSNTSHDFEKN